MDSSISREGVMCCCWRQGRPRKKHVLSKPCCLAPVGFPRASLRMVGFLASCRQDSPYDRPENGPRSGNKFRSVPMTQEHQITPFLSGYPAVVQ
jgi:hypothetical protein